MNFFLYAEFVIILAKSVNAFSESAKNFSKQTTPGSLTEKQRVRLRTLAPQKRRLSDILRLLLRAHPHVE